MDLVLRAWRAGPGFLEDGNKPHLVHKPAYPLAAHAPTLPAKMARHLPRTVPGRLKELLVDQPHEREVHLALPARRAVERRARNRQKLALPGNREPRMVCLNHSLPPLVVQRPEALAKKSRSMTSWPILA